tara:strand:+ start:510 stop:956 length:447 start_codon:yes stop_codon:yes gene_type:complete
MPFDRSYVGHTYPIKKVEVEKGRLVYFSKTINESNPIYFDENQAHAEGYKSILVPPTFLFSLSIEGETLLDKYGKIGMDFSKLLHGAQEFVYHDLAYAGDTLTFQAKIKEMYSKKDGALDFCVEEIIVKNQHELHISTLTQTYIMREN